jgi:hypothetical protein
MLISKEYVTFDLPASIQQSIPGWLQGAEGSSFEETLQALLSSTGDPSVYQLSNVSSDDIINRPLEEIEVSMGEMPFTTHDPFNFDTNLDFSSFMAQSQDQSTVTSSAQDMQPLLQDFSVLFSDKPMDQSQRDFSSSDSNIFQYINLEPTLKDDDSPDTAAYPTPSPQNEKIIAKPATTPSTSQHTPYTPPAGAALSSTRRVAANWKPSFSGRPDSPVDHSPPQQWGVSAS